MTYDKIKIGSLMSTIQKYIAELDSYKIQKTDDLYDRRNYHASSMVVLTILNKVIDLANEIIFSENLGSPNTYEDIMPSLASANVINKEQANELNKLIKYRNILAHYYEEIKEKDLLFLIKRISTIENFLRTIAKRIG